MLHRISVLAFLGLTAALLVAAPANADGVPVHLNGDLERDADAAPHYWHHVHIGENLKFNADRFSTFDRNVFDSDDFKNGKHEFWSGVPNTAEWIWWLNHSDKDKKEFGKNPVGDAPVATPEPASLILLGSGVLALGAWRRANHSASIS